MREARSRYLKLLAWLNDAEHAALPPATRHERWAAFDAGHPEPATAVDVDGFRGYPREFTHSGEATRRPITTSAVPSQDTAGQMDVADPSRLSSRWPSRSGE